MEDEKEHPIDAQLRRAMEKDGSTAGMVQALARAERQWDAVLNDAYQALMRSLGNEGRARLKSSQRAWLTFRDRDRLTLRSVFNDLDGTMYRPMAGDAYLTLTRDRALMLLRYHRVRKVAGK